MQPRIWGVTIADLLLYTNIDLPADFHKFISPLVPIWPNSFPQVKHIAYSFGVLYGTVSLILAFTFVFFKRNGFANFVILANGLFGGYYLTILISKNFFQVADLDISPKLIYFRLAYVLFAYYIFEGLKNLIDTNLAHRKKYQLLFDGMFLLVCTLILMKEFHSSTASILTGPLFLISFFLATIVVEQTVGRWLFTMTTLTQLDFPDETPKPTIKALLKLVWKTFRSYKGQMAEFSFPVLNIRSTFRQRPLCLTFSLIWFVVAALFPVFAAIVYQLILYGHL